MIGISRDEIAAVARKHGYAVRVIEALCAEYSLNPDAAAAMWHAMPEGMIQEVERLRDEAVPIDEERAQQAEALAAQQRADAQPQPILVNYATVQPKPIDWMWRKRIAVGKLTLLVGDPGASKSTLTIDMAARLSRGLPLPDGSQSEPANTIIMNAEDEDEDTVVPRLDLAGADRNRIEALKGVTCRGVDREVDLGDVLVIEKAIRQTAAKLVIVDPLNAYISEKTNTNMDAQIRRVLRPLKELAERSRVAMLLLVHLNKNVTLAALYRVCGSIGYVGAARSVLAVAVDPDDPERRVIGRIKGNVGRRPPDLAYRLVPVGGDDEDHAKLEWSQELLPPKTVERLMGAAVDEESRGSLEAAKEYLAETLGTGPAASKSVIREALDLGISLRTLRRAEEKLGVKANKVDNSWYMRLPNGHGGQECQTGGQECQIRKVGTLDPNY